MLKPEMIKEISELTGQTRATAVPAAINAQAQEWLSDALSREGSK